MQVMQPFGQQVDLHSGMFSPAGPITRRSLSDMRAMYADTDTANRIMKDEGDRLIYEVYGSEVPEGEGQVLYCTTIIYPGRIGDEYHMTKGHFHTKRDRGEVYLGLAGEGTLLLQLEDGTVNSVPMREGTAAYVPPYWAHRTANTGATTFSFFAAWPGDAGHDYATIEKVGFAKLLVEQNGKPTLIPNSRYR